MEAYATRENIHSILVHTGQHYDPALSDLFFLQLGIPEPDVNLGVGSGSHAGQTASIMQRIEPVFLEHQPDVVVVVGDVNSTISCGLVAVKLGIRLVHVEAGLRSFDRSMPEEINRILTDSISDLLFCTEKSGCENLLREGHDPASIHLVGNVMVDSLLRHRKKAEQCGILDHLGLKAGGYGVLTLHRPSNVDDPKTLRGILTALEHIRARLPIVFPVHPRTRKNLQRFSFDSEFERMEGVIAIEPTGYLEFLKLMSSARLILTDSGGIQEESTILQVPCLTLRENTERPVTCALGTNRLVGLQPERIIKAFDNVMNGHAPTSTVPPLWDGHAAERIVSVLRNSY